MVTYGVCGTGGFAREVMPVVLRMLAAAGEGDPNVVFVDRAPAPPVNGRRVVSTDEFLGLPGERRYCIAIGDGRIRRRIANEFAASDAVPFDVIAPTATVMDCNAWDEGLILAPFATITSNARLGRHVHLNLYAYVAHDCEVGDFVTLAPNAQCNGRVVIEDDVYVGAGAIIRHGEEGEPIVIGRGAVVGMGAVVTRSVPPGVTVVGNPARHLTSR